MVIHPQNNQALELTGEAARHADRRAVDGPGRWRIPSLHGYVSTKGPSRDNDLEGERTLPSRAVGFAAFKQRFEKFRIE